MVGHFWSMVQFHGLGAASVFTKFTWFFMVRNGVGSLRSYSIFGVWKSLNTLFEIFIFVIKIQLWFPEKIVDFLWVKNSWKCCGFGLFSCWQLWFHEKNCQKKLGEKLVKMLGFCQNWIFGQKFDFSNSGMNKENVKKNLEISHKELLIYIFRSWADLYLMRMNDTRL